MKHLSIAALSSVFLLALTACATGPEQKTGAAAVPSPPGKDDCLFMRTVDDWAAIDRERLMIYGMGKVPYLATLSFPSNDLTFDIAIGFDDHDRNGRLCGDGFDGVILRDSVPQRIPIRSLQRIEKADADAFLAATNPKYKSKKVEKPADDAAPAATPAPAPTP